MVTPRLIVAIGVAALAAALASTACLAEVGFYVDKRTGCRFGMADFHKDATVQWSGGCKDGFFDGPGVVTLTHSTAGEKYAVVRIEGTFVGGGLNGRALITYADGTRYEGEMRRGQRVGRGRLVKPGIGYADVTYQAGGYIEYAEFQYDKDCRCDTPGARYVGEMFAGKRNGKGIFTLANGDKYEGEWHDDLPRGAGTLTHGGKKYSSDWLYGCLQSGSTTYKFLASSCSP